jgi:hypothetical protein
MAIQDKNPGVNQDKNPGVNTSEISSQAVALAEQLGRIAGTIEGTAEKWMDRASLTDQLTAVRDRAAQLLESLARGVARRQTGRKEGAQARATEAASTADKGNSAAGKGSSAAGKGSSAAGKGSSAANKGKSARASKARPDLAHAPGKQHRKPAPTVHGAKHSDMWIPKAKASAAARQRRRSFT